MAGPRQIIDPPAYSPSPFGLFSVVQLRRPTDPHWQNGVIWASYCPDFTESVTYDECIATTGTPDNGVPEPAAKAANVDYLLRAATPFTPYVRFDCSTVGNEEAQRIATETLARTEEWQVENAFWTGFVQGRPIVWPHLAATTEVMDPSSGGTLQLPTVVLGNDNPTDVATGLGILSNHLADCYGGVGVIHIPQELLPTLEARHLVHTVAGRDVGTGQFGKHLETLAGNLVAVGGGYPGTSPDGANPTSGATWMYATGPIFMYRSDVYVNPFSSTVDRTNNTVEMIAERTYVIGWDCCVAATQVQLGAPAG